MANKEATARIKINKLLEAANWRFFPEGSAAANIRLEPSVTIKSSDLEALGENFEKTSKLHRLPAARGGDALEKYRGKIVKQFFPARGDGKLKLGEARKAIRDYRKATGNLYGTAELLMTYVENGTRFTDEYGDIDERFYSSVESALEELAELLCGEAREMYPQFAGRLARVEQMADGIGWGFGDYVAGVVGRLEDELGGR